MNVVVVGGGVAGIVAALELRGGGRVGDAGRGPPAAGRCGVLGGARTTSGSTTASTSSCAAAPPTATCSRRSAATELVELQPRLRDPRARPGPPGGDPSPVRARDRRCISRGRCCATPFSRLRERVRAGRAALALGTAAPDDSRTLGDWLARARAESAGDRRAVGPDRAADAQPAGGGGVARARRVRLPAGAAPGRRRRRHRPAPGAAAADHRRPGRGRARARRRRRCSCAGAPSASRRSARASPSSAPGGSWLGADAVIVAVPHDRAAGILPDGRAARRARGRVRCAARRSSTCTSSMTAGCSSTPSPRASTRRCSTSSTVRRPHGTARASTSRSRSRARAPSSR